MTGPSRRTVLKGAGGLALAAAVPLRVHAEGGATYALSVFGEHALAEDFSHFPYVNPDAPKGGRLSLIPSSWTSNQNPLTYDTFNMFILRGDSPLLMQLCHTSLMARNLEEPDAVYAYMAEGVEVDGKRYAFTLRDGTTFSDGSAITAADVVFSLEALREHGHPAFAGPLAGVASVEAADERTAVITFADSASNRLPPLVASYPILSRAWHEAHPITDATLDIPVSSGPYTVGRFEPGRFVEYDKREDYWGDDLPAGRGHNNFDTVRVEFYRERTLGFEALKTGQLNFREEFTSKVWATEYNFPAARRGDVVQQEFPDERPAGAQGYFINTRRAKFADPRTREAIGLCFDFEWTNANLFFGLYERTHSFFQNSQMMATGEPSEEERALLERFGDQVKPEALGPAWTPAVTDASGRDRTPLRRAAELLAEAGWVRKEGGLVNEAGERLSIEYLYPSQPTSERIFQPYANRLRLLGIDATLRPVDAAQYQSREKDFEFDLVLRRFAFTSTPTDSIREFFVSSAAERPGSYNLAGISDPVVDALVDEMLAAPTRDEMNVAARALDRVLRVGHYWVPNWYKAKHTVAYWVDELAHPEAKPRYDLPVASTWWAKDA